MLDADECLASFSGNFYPGGKSCHYPMNRRFDGLQSWSGCGGKEKNP